MHSGELRSEAAVSRLVAVMEESHRAMERFDGSAFALSVQEEVGLCSKILAESVPGASLSKLDMLFECCRVRQAWLRSMQRTVRALRGVCAAARETYDVHSLAGQ